MPRAVALGDPSAERCVALDPDKEEYQGRLETIKARRRP